MNRLNHAPLIIALALLAGLLLSNGVTAQSPPGAYETIPCSGLMPDILNLGNVACGQLTVPQKHANPNGPTLALNVITFKATGANPLPDPLILLQGGPGGSTIDTYSQLVPTMSDILAQRDIILFDQRGTLHSDPFLFCDETLALTLDTLSSGESTEAELALIDEATQACADRQRSAGIDLSAFNSLENAADIDLLAQQLGLAEINLYGVSYGTLLALHTMQHHPERLRSVILDAVIPPQLNFLQGAPYAMDNAFTTFFAACTAASTCNQTYPDLADTFYQTVADLNATPAALNLLDSETGESHSYLMTGDDLVEHVFTLLYSTEIIPLLPEIITATANGDYAILEYLLPLFLFDRTMSEGMYAAVMCAEDNDFNPTDIDLSGVRPEFAENTRTTYSAIKSLCRAFDVPQFGPEIDAAVESNIPTLLLSGQFDPITPAAYARSAAQTLPNSYRVTFPNTGHGAFLSNDCANELVANFLDNPYANPDRGCVAEQTGPDFITSREVAATPLNRIILGLFEGQYLAGAALFGLTFAGLLSAWLVIPLAWLIRTLSNTNNTRRDIGSAMLNLIVLAAGGIIGLFILGVIIMVFQVALSNEMLLLVGVPRSWLPLFGLAVLFVLLAFGMLLGTVVAWRRNYWWFWQRLYYTVISLSGISLTIMLVKWGVFDVFVP